MLPAIRMERVSRVAIIHAESVNELKKTAMQRPIAVCCFPTGTVVQGQASGLTLIRL